MKQGRTLQEVAAELARQKESKSTARSDGLKRPIVFICSPYRGDVESNSEAARCYCRLACQYGGIPFAPHLLFTQFLDDSKEKERDAGLAMGVAMLELCDEIWVFGEPTAGMRMEIAAAHATGKPVRRFDTNCREVTVHE